MVRRIVMRLWLRGFLPAALLLLLWAASIFTHTVVRLPGTHDVRAACSHGVILANWDAGPRRRWIGNTDWELGPNLGSDLLPISGVWTFWNLRRPTVQFDVEVHPGHLKFPVLYLAFLASLSPAAAIARRRRRRARGRCLACGYDLAGITGPCPECGRGRQEREA